MTCSTISAQTYRQYIKAADEAVNGRNYFAAMKYYQEAMAIDGEKLDVLYKYAEAARLFQSYTYADTAYTKILALDSSQMYPLASYWLATVKKKQGKFEDSQKLFEGFVSKRKPEVDGEFYRLALMEIDALEWVIETIKETDPNISLEQLPNSVNSPYSEFAAVEINGKVFFSSENNQRIVKKGMPPRQYAQVMHADEQFQNTSVAPFNDAIKQTAHAAFNKDKTRVYYTICDYVGETAIVMCDIFFRDILQDGTYGPATALPSSINVNGYTATQPAVGFLEDMGKECLFFVTDRPEGRGGLDIWASVINENGDFSPPFALTELNTPGNDITPFYHNLSHTLYFSSDRRQGFGGQDIYKSARVHGKWERVEHLSSPFNSSYNDTHFWMNEMQTRGYLSSSRLGSHVLEPEFEACCNDLYLFMVQVVDLTLYTFNKRNQDPLNEVTVELIEFDPNGNWSSKTTRNSNSNDFNFQLRKGNNYIIKASKPGFYSVTDTLDLSKIKDKGLSKIEKKLFLLPESVELNVVTYNKKTMNLLYNVEIRLAVDGQEVDFINNRDKEKVSFNLERGKLYELIGAKVAYVSDTAVIDLRNDFNTTTINQILNLRPKELEEFISLPLYFDNDQPDPRTRNRTTALSYETTWTRYMERKDIFRQEYVKNLSGRDSLSAASRMDAFFDREVNNGYMSLLALSENILTVLKDGEFKVELLIQGFTSPRASEDYNYDLSQRRADCLKNHFETWNNGILLPYIRREMLIMEVVGYGERLAPQFISDRLDDERESIYSVFASSERKVAIKGARRVAVN